MACVILLDLLKSNTMANRNPEQLFNQGLDYFLGIGKDKNMIAARKLMQEAADMGLVKAAILLADWYVKDYIPSDNHMEAIELYEKCCSMGDTQALCRLGMCYKKGIGVRKDLVRSLEYYIKAYEGGMMGACFEIALAYEKGLGVEKDLEQAIRWYQEGAEAGDPECAGNLGFCYYHGAGIPRDVDKAKELFLKNSDFNAVIQKNLGVIFYKGTKTCPPDEKMGIHWLSVAAGNGDYISALHLGDIFRKKDRDESMKWYARAAALDKKKGAYTYAFYLYKYNEPGAWESAFNWMKRSADHRYIPAMFMLGLFYKSGVGTTVDHAKAFYWFKLAAENEYEQAYSHIGRYYRTGQIVAVNYEIALQWYEKAITSKSDNVRGEALYDYGVMYLKGLGVSRNREKAIAYLCQARNLKCLNAINMLEELNNPELNDKHLDRIRVLEEGDIIQYVRMKLEDQYDAANWVPDILRKLEAQVDMVKEKGIARKGTDGRYIWTLGNIDFAQWVLLVSDKLCLYSVDEERRKSYHPTYFARLFLNKNGREFKPEDLRHNMSKINNVHFPEREKNYDLLKSVIEDGTEVMGQNSMD